LIHRVEPAKQAVNKEERQNAETDPEQDLHRCRGYKAVAEARQAGIG
jgi:hypothetical protein